MVDDAQARLRVAGRTLAELTKERPFGRAENRLLGAAAAGEMADFTEPDWADDKKSIRAELIRVLALARDDDAPVHERGIRIKGASIQGDIDLENARVEMELTLQSCEIVGTINLRDAELFGINLTGSSMTAIAAERVRTHVIVLATGFRAGGTVNLSGARIAGDLICAGGRFENESPAALLLDGAEIKGSAYLNNGFVAKGTVQLTTASISGNLDRGNGHFEGTVFGEWRNALVCDQAKVGASIFLNRIPDSAEPDWFSARGLVSIARAQVGGDIICSEGSFTGGRDEGALLLSGSVVKGRVYLNGVSTTGGHADLTGADISGDLDCSGGTFAGWIETTAEGAQRWASIVCDRAKIGGSVLLKATGASKEAPSRPFIAKGRVQIHNASVGTNLDCSGGHFDGDVLTRADKSERRGQALMVDQTTIGAGVFLCNGFRSNGTVSLMLARVGGSISCENGTFMGAKAKDAEGLALMLDRIDVKNSVYLRDIPAVKGAVRLMGATIAGDLDCSGSSFEAWSFEPTPAQKDELNERDGQALLCQQARIGGNIWLSGRFNGVVNLLGAGVARDLKCQGGTFNGRSREALNLDRCRIERSFEFADVAGFRGAIVLNGARAGALLDDAASWNQRWPADADLAAWNGASPLRLDGFRYDSPRPEGADRRRNAHRLARTAASG
jgi:hypothetical protein